jgi:hypothetical protein
MYGTSCTVFIAMLSFRIFTFNSLHTRFPSFFLSLLFFFLNLNIYGEADSKGKEANDLFGYDLKVFKNASINELLPEGVSLTRSLVNTEMPKLKTSELGKILTRYYNKCLGGASHWKTVKSIRISGDLNTLNGLYQYESVIKKPNLYKISLSNREATNLIAFDGSKIRQKLVLKESNSVTPLAGELYSEESTLDRIVNETELPRYLLYPMRADKAFQYLGTVREFNTVCFKLRLFTDQNFIIDYFIDVESYLIVTIQILDTLNVFSPASIEYSDYRLVDGAYHAHKIKSYLNGQWDSTLTIKAITPNVGATKWMFNLGHNSL